MGDTITFPTAHTGLVVQPYRADDGSKKWVFRCWGTDTCEGGLSLDHTSEQSAARALARHIEDEHGATAPAPEMRFRISGGLTDTQRREVEQIVERYMRNAASRVGRA